MQAPHLGTPALFKLRIVASVAVVPLLVACGYKGPLYMPPPPPPEESLTAPPQAPAETGTAPAVPSAVK
ncbi:MAG TPA: lipoprotein [Pusillimonas sp.]|jgi:predicted small lipoprotein YifL|uniref:LPS translocon maturation chaperone LptM n=1 Tax=unclassified Pusillimonas TaxID=2640016 RepID=UPI002606B9EA|nr:MULTISPECIES: lipoprotein [unclassified Pusillimonas]HLU20530.1 lipoprotein [Pusillimonas sp.]